MASPKLFISYSWSNPVIEQRALELATELRESGVDVILDKWDLKEGHDAHAFMEKMVTDPTIEKVAMIFDRSYAEKADGRSGGVGTETQIISGEVYKQQAQDKFVAIIVEKDEHDKPYLPIYYKSRIFIDLSEPAQYTENYEKLLRWIYNKPLYKKPELGKVPAFLSDSESISLGTSAIFKKTIEAIKNNKETSLGILDEYLEIYIENLERFRLQKGNGEFDEAVLRNIEAFLPYRNELIQLFIIISQYAPNEAYIQKLHRFFERLIPYLHRPQNLMSYQDWDFDNFRFIVHELFLYAISVLLKHERFNETALLLSQRYYLPNESGRDPMVTFMAFHKYMKSLGYRNERLSLNRLSVRADLLKERCNATGIELRHLMQADFVLFMRAQLETVGGYGWWPETLLWLENYHGSFEIFSRASSRKYFERVKCLLNINSPNDLDSLLQSYSEGNRKLPNWGFDSFSPSALLGYELLAKQP